MSALHDSYQNELVDALVGKVDVIYGLKTHKLKYHFSEHDKRREWLLKFANVSNVDNFEYEGDHISLDVNIDDVVYQQYLKTFERDSFDALRDSQKMMAPKGW
jgi:hypothetical protein